MVKLLVSCLLVLCLVPRISQSKDAAAVPGRFIVKFKQGASERSFRLPLATGQALTAPSFLELKSTLVGGDVWRQYAIFATTDTLTTTDEVIQIFGPDNIELVEQDMHLEFFDFPNDSLFSDQWYLRNTGQLYKAIERMPGDFNDILTLKSGAPGFDIAKTSLYLNQPAEKTRVVVAIVDSGADTEHPELQGQFWRNPDEIAGNGIDDDHNGFVDDTLGYDVSGDVVTIFQPTGDNDPTDIVGHGTHVAGLIAAKEDGLGIVGVAPRALIMPVKIRPNATNAVGAAGILYAVNAGAQVINLSWGTPYESAILRDAITIARLNGVFVAIAAGNSGNNARFYPAAFDSAFAVGATRSDGYMTTFSSFGSHLDISAPGQDMLSLRSRGTDMYSTINEPGVRIVGPDSLYYLSDGTSMATPLVCGAAALLWSFRPDLSLGELERVLRMGAHDLLDPQNKGQHWPGPDSLSGFGNLNVETSLSLASQGGIHLLAPNHRQRYTTAVNVKAAPIAGYGGGWTLQFRINNDSLWTTIANGTTLPLDSLLYQFNDPARNGNITLRLTDDFGRVYTKSFLLVQQDKLEVTSPVPGAEYSYNVPLAGTVYGPQFDSVSITYSSPTAAGHLYSTTQESFDTLIHTWAVSGVTPGEYDITIRAWFAGIPIDRVVPVIIRSVFATGWPKPLSGRGALSPVAADIDGDNYKEIIVGTSNGLFVFTFDGRPLPGFPVLTDYDMRTIPAVYDLDHDGAREIICTNELGLWAFRKDGTLQRGWPRFATTMATSFGFPIPTVAKLATFADSAIVLINGEGQVLAYEFNGDPYFYSLEGWFASFNSTRALSYVYGGNIVSSADLDGDRQREVIVTYSTNGPKAGVALFDARTGQNAYGRPLPQVIDMSVCYGTILADLTGDRLPEIISTGTASNNSRMIAVNTHGTESLSGWPLSLPSVNNWRGSYPTVADLDLDGTPEILATFFELDIAALYVFNADGSAYLEREGRPYGEAYSYPATFGAPIVADLTGDLHPEIIVRSGYIFPFTGTEKVHILDHTMSPIQGWPVSTPAMPSQVFSTIYTPLADDIDNDGKMELALVGEAGAIYVWDFDASSRNGTNMGRLFLDPLNSSLYRSDSIATEVDPDEDLLPKQYALRQNYPNPFNPRTSIVFELPKRSHATVRVTNILGQEVTRIVDKVLGAGRHTVYFDGSQHASGVYFYTLETADYQQTHKMVLVK